MINFSLFSAPSHDKEHIHKFIFTKPNNILANTIIWASVIIVTYTLYLSLKFIFFPGEKNPNHIKNIIKDDYFR